MKNRSHFGPYLSWAVLLVLLGPASVLCQEVPGEALTLPRAVALALETHPLVGQAGAVSDAAGAMVKEARSAWYPTLVGQGGLTRHEEPMLTAPLHELTAVNPPVFDQNLVQGAISLAYTLYDGGARSARIQRAEAGERAAEAGGEGAQMAVTTQVSATYLGILSSEELLSAVLSQKEALRAELDRVRLFLDQGKAARVDLLRVEAALSRVEAQEVSARSDVGLYRSRLARLTGLEQKRLQGMALGSVTPRGSVDPARELAVASALEANAELAQVREGLAGAQAGVREAGAAWYPKISADGRYADFGTLGGGHVQEWQGSLKLSYPLFTGGARGGERDRAQAEEHRVAESVRLAELEVEDQVETALAVVKETRAVREALSLAVEQTEEVARIEALALEAGAGVQTDFLGAQADLFQARASLSRARHGEVMAHIELARVKGDLSLAWIEENMEMVR